MDATPNFPPGFLKKSTRAVLQSPLHRLEWANEAATHPIKHSRGEHRLPITLSRMGRPMQRTFRLAVSLRDQLRSDRSGSASNAPSSRFVRPSLELLEGREAPGALLNPASAAG